MYPPQRERRVAQHYLVEFAEELNVGSIYGSKQLAKSLKGERKPKTGVAKGAAKNAATQLKERKAAAKAMLAAALKEKKVATKERKAAAAKANAAKTKVAAMKAKKAAAKAKLVAKRTTAAAKLMTKKAKQTAARKTSQTAAKTKKQLKTAKTAKKTKVATGAKKPAAPLPRLKAKDLAARLLKPTKPKKPSKQKPSDMSDINLDGATSSQPTDTATFAVRTLTGKVMSVPLATVTTYDELTAFVLAQQGVPAERQRFLFKGLELTVNASLAAQGIAAGSVVFFVLRIG